MGPRTVRERMVSARASRRWQRAHRDQVRVYRRVWMRQLRLMTIYLPRALRTIEELCIDGAPRVDIIR